MGLLDEITTSVPATKYIEKYLITIDGVFQAIRCFKQGHVIKEIVTDVRLIFLFHPRKSIWKMTLMPCT